MKSTNTEESGKRPNDEVRVVKRKERDVPIEEEAVSRLIRNDARCSELFVKTRTTLLRRVNAGDQAAFTDFYNIYCPAMLKYLGLYEGSRKERDQWDIVQTVFVKFYKAFALVKDPVTGKKRIPRCIFSIFGERKNKATGKTYSIKFRHYLITCLKNAVRTKWRADTKKGTVNVLSLDSRIQSKNDGKERPVVDLVSDEMAHPENNARAKEDKERQAAIWDIWQAVTKGVLLDEALDDCTRDVIYQSLANNAKAADLAEKWGITENYAYQIKHRGCKMAKKVTRAIFEMISEADVDIDEEAARLYRVVASMKPNKRKHIDKFMIELAKELLAQRK